MEEQLNINELFKLLKTKGYNYVEVNLGGTYYEFNFSTGYHGRGKSVEIQMYHNGFSDISFYDLIENNNSQHKNKTPKQIRFLIELLPNN